jgi:hypothetical protein
LLGQGCDAEVRLWHFSDLSGQANEVGSSGQSGHRGGARGGPELSLNAGKLWYNLLGIVVATAEGTTMAAINDSAGDIRAGI